MVKFFGEKKKGDLNKGLLDETAEKSLGTGAEAQDAVSQRSDTGSDTGTDYHAVPDKISEKQSWFKAAVRSVGDLFKQDDSESPTADKEIASETEKERVIGASSLTESLLTEDQKKDTEAEDDGQERPKYEPPKPTM